MIPTKTIQLDFWRHPTDILHLVQGEADGRKVEFKIFDNGSAFDLTGYTVQMAVKKPDGNIVVNSGTITDAANGVCEVTITSQVVAVVGSLHAELQILKEGQLSKSFRIVTKVAAGVDAEGIAPSVTEFGVLTDLITDVEAALSITDTELWPVVVANAEYFTDLAGAGRTIETVKGNADDITGHIADDENPHTVTLAQLGAAADADLADLAGAGRTTETVKGNADDIADLAGVGRNTETVKKNADDIALKADADDLADLAGDGRTNQTVKANADDIADLADDIALKANATDLSNLAGDGRTTETVKANADDISDLAGDIANLAGLGRTTETVKGAADAIANLAGTGRTTETVKGAADAVTNLAGAGRNTETVKANADEIAALEAEIETARAGSATLTDEIQKRARTLNSGALQTVTDKNRYYPLLSNVGGQLMGMHQTNVWTGSAWAATNNYGFGDSALSNNTGRYSNGFGESALSNNTGGTSNGFGESALSNNTGLYSNGFGASALSSNTGAYSNGFGFSALSSNTGASSIGFGTYALSSNTGAYSNGFGASALRYNQSSNNTAIGNNAYSAFLTNVAGAKTCADTDINITDERATITAHGFGADNAVVILRYTATTGTEIGGLPINTIFQAKIIDADTIEFVSGSQKLNLTSQGTGTHTFTPQFAYSNTTCLGASTVPNKSNQVVLGDTKVDTVKMGGTTRTPASATDTGVKGEMCWDANYIYICVATNTWKRSALSTW